VLGPKLKNVTALSNEVKISFGIWILKFGFFRQNLKMTNDKAQMSNQAQNPNV